MPSSRAASLHPDVVALLRWFEVGHLASPHLRAVVKPFRELAWENALTLERTQELIDTLTHLRNAKDSAVRAHVLVVDPIAPEDLTEPEGAAAPE